MQGKKVSFELFRYQILPINRVIQTSIDNAIGTIDELLAQKNEFFTQALLSSNEFVAKKTLLQHKLLHQSNDEFLYKFAANRSLHRETKEFTVENIDNWPKFLVYLCNDPEKQIIAVEERRKAFQKTDTPVQAIVDAINKKLESKNLRVHFKPLFLTNVFWNLMEVHKGKVLDVRFELITPNMSNISDTVSDELKQLAKDTNTAQTNLQLQADPGSAILISPEDKTVKGLVEYAGEGGGNISAKVRGYSKRISTKTTKKTISIDEIEVVGSPKEVVKILKRLIG